MALWNRIAFPISNIWDHGDGQKDSSSFTAGGGNAASGGLAPEGIDSSQDSLTQYMRSLTNMLGQQGQATFGQGQQGYGAGQKTLEGAIPTLKQSLQGLAAPEQYYQNLLSGDKAAMESAVAPETSSILDQYRGKRSQMAKLGPRGGGTNEAIAGSQFGQAGDVAKVLQTVRPQAAQGAQGVSQARATIGKGIADVGATQGELGLKESGQGLQQLSDALQGLLQRRGQNFGVDTANRQALVQGLESVFKALV